MKTKMTLALVALITGTAFGSMPAVLPEFKNAKQLAEWRTEMADKANAASSASDVPSAFYTGKPYIESSDGYAFKYRSYNPELARWTSEDPSGFPDGANGNIYAPTPTSSLDYSGLWKLQIVGSTSTSDGSMGTVTIGEYDHHMGSNSNLSTTDITSSSTAQSGTVTADFSGIMFDTNWNRERFAPQIVKFTVSVNNSGIISIAYDSGGFNAVDGNLQVGGAWSKDIGNDHTATLTFGAASQYSGTGLTGIDLQAQAFTVGGEASVTWTNPAGKQDSGTTLKFKAVE